MNISGTDLAHLAEYLPALRLFARFTPTSVDDAIIAALERIGEDQELLDMLARWLSWVPVFGSGDQPADLHEPDLPECLKGMRADLEAWRTWMVSQ